MWTIFKVFIASALCFDFWLWGMWDLSPMTRDQTATPCIRRQVLTTGLPGKAPEVQLLSHMVTCVSFSCDNLCVFTDNRHKKTLLMCKLIFYFFLWFLVTFLYIFHENSLFWVCIAQLDEQEFEWSPGVGDDREAWRATIHGVSKGQTRLSDWT